MRVIIEADAGAVARRAATMVAKLVRARPKASLALPTGQTPLGLYRELVRLHREEGLDFAGVSCFQLDEYYGLPADDPRSFRSYLQSELLDHLNVSPRRSHALDGAAVPSVVLKQVQPPRTTSHPRGWDGERSHRRKLRSYEVEAAWYRDWSRRCDARCRVPGCLAVEPTAGGWRFLLEAETTSRSPSPSMSAAETAVIP